MDSKIISALFFVSFDLALLFPSINCSTVMRHAAGGGRVSGFSFNCSVEFQQEQQIAWEMSISGFNTIIGSKMLLTSQDLYGNSTPLVLSGTINNTFGGTHDWISSHSGNKMIIGAPMISNNAQPFSGFSLDALVENMQLDATVGDTEIIADHYQGLAFSRPSMESRFTMVVKDKPNEVYKFWWFLRPFTLEMWLTMVALSVYAGFVIWLIESQNENEPDLLAALLFFLHRDAPRNRLANFVQVPWLFLLLVVTSTYTTSFTSMVTSPDTKPSCLDIENLKIRNVVIGCDGDSTIFRYLVELGFKPKNIMSISQSSIDDYEKALSSGKIKAAFFLAPYADVFLAKYSKGFSAWESIRNLRHSTIVFPQGSPFVSEMPKFEEMKEYMLSFLDCSSSTSDGSMKGIGPRPFLGLFIISGGASTIAMLITVIGMIKRRWENQMQRMLMDRELWVWLTALFLRKQRRNVLQIEAQG